VLVAVDVGNSHTTVGVFDDEDSLVGEIRLGTRRGWTRDEFAVALRQALELRDLTLGQIDDAVLACVVPPVQPIIEQALSTYVGIEPLVVGPGVKTGMPIRYEPPQDVGADRIVTAVAAHHRHGVADHGIIVVDFGTATTFDVVSPRPEYLGGAIAPGVGISADALFSRAARLPRVEAARPPFVVGTNTVAAIQSGIVYGYVGLVEGIIARIRDEVSWPMRVIATGGFAGIVAEASSVIDTVDDALVLEGLRLIYRRNRTTHARTRRSASSPGGGGTTEKGR
jgi:type III pantothenate kinase